MTGPRRTIVRGAAVATAVATAVAMLWAGVAAAQDFVPAEPAGPAATPSALLERGLPAPEGNRFEALTTSWLGVPGLVTRAACGVVSVRSVCVATGWSQTGEQGSGWRAVGLGLGVARVWGGLALRAILRQDLVAEVAPRERGGAEAGGGAWLEAGDGIRVWASAPQLVTAGAAPPLARALAGGVSIEREGLLAWLEHEAPARDADESGARAAGVGLSVGRARVWVEGRDRPLRAGFGVTVTPVGARALGHPRLGDTVTLSLRLPVHP